MVAGDYIASVLQVKKRQWYSKHHRNALIHLNNSPLMPTWSNFRSCLSCGTELNAFAKSKNTA